MSNSFYKIFFFLIISLISSLAVAQDNETLIKTKSDTLADTVQDHSVLKATLYSTALPGLGQIYNRKYWKVPVIYAGLATTTYFIIDNHQQYKNYLNAFYAVIDNDSTTMDPYNGRYTERQLIELQNIYRKWRDLSIIITAAFYALNILDAHVDAHLYYYDVSDKLSLHWEPAVINSGFANAYGLSLKLSIK